MSKLFAIGDYNKYGCYALVCAETRMDALNKYDATKDPRKSLINRKKVTEIEDVYITENA